VVETAGDPGPSGDLRRQLRILPTSGVYFVELIVTDSDGLSSTTYKRFEIEPRSPVAEARVTPVAGGTGAAGTTVFELAARWAEDGVVQGTRHPDGTLVEYRWTLTGSGLVYEAVRSTPDPWYLALPPVMAGNVAVTLVVTDDEGRSATAATGIVLEPQPADQAIAEGTMWPAGAQLPPANLRLAGPAGSVGGAQVTWDPAPQADRYVVEVDPGCAPGVLRAVTPPGELTAAVLPARCVGSDQVRVRVAAELAGALSAWSGWLDVTLPVTAADPAEVEVVSPFEEAGG
jgi:hypothetical protein